MRVPDSLQKKLKEKKVIPFVGAGVSMSVLDNEPGKRLFPSWKELLNKAADKLEKDKPAYAGAIRSVLELDKPDYHYAAQKAHEGFKADWFDFLRDELDLPYSRVKEESLALAKLVWGLGSNFIITTNYDRVLKWGCPNQNDFAAWNIQAPAEQAALLKNTLPNRPTVWHLHGNLDDTANLILTPDGYEKLYFENDSSKEKYEAALTTLRSLLASHTFLFIGFSMDDEHFGGQMRGVKDIFKGATGRHYVLARKAEKQHISDLNPDLEILTYEEHGEPLLELLQKISEAAKSDTEINITTEAKVPDEKPPDIPNPQSYDLSNRPSYIPFNAKGEQHIGREDKLQDVHKMLQEGHRTAIGQAVAFEGLGGLGKTQLAVEYAHRFGKEYKNGVIWLTADQDIDAQLIDVSDRAGWISPLSEHKDKLAVALHRLRSYSDCLIIFDNLESFSDIEKYLPEPSVNVFILATTRTEQPNFQPLRIDLLTPELSLKFLTQEARREPQGETENTAANNIAEALGGLPLALELAGAYLRHRSTVSWQQYFELLSKNPKYALPPKLLSSFTKHDTDVYRTLKLNEEFLNEELHMREILDLLTWSGTSPMSISLMCALLNLESYELTGALGLCESLRLLKKSPDMDAYAIHRLVAQVRREDIPLADRKDWINNTCQRLGDWFQDLRDDFKNLPEYEVELPHLSAWQEISLEHAIEHTSRLTWLQGYPPYYRGLYQEALDWVQEALNLYDEKKCENPESLAHLYNDIGNLLSYLGDYNSAFDNTEKALKLRLELFGEKHSDTATSFNNIGSAYGKLGNYKKRLEFTLKALEIRKETVDKKHRNISISLNNVGLAYGDLGNYEKQLEFTLEALEIRKEILGEKHPDTATAFNNVGLTYGMLGNYEKQLELILIALEIKKEILGEKHPDTATAFNNVGNAYGGLGDKKNALKFIEEGLNAYLDQLGEKHPNTIWSVCNFADALVDNNRRQEALDLIEEYRHKISPSHPRYKMLMETRNGILSQPLQKGFRQPSKKTKGKTRKRRR